MKVIRLLFILLGLCIAHSENVQGQWRNVPVPFDSLTNVQAVTRDFIVVSSKSYELAKSSDAGNAWYLMDLDIPSEGILKKRSPYTGRLAFHFLDTGFAVAGAAYLDSSPRTLSTSYSFTRTEDGGSTWNSGAYLATHAPYQPVWIRMFSREWGMVAMAGRSFIRHKAGDTLKSFFQSAGLGWTDDSANSWLDFTWTGDGDTVELVNSVHFRVDGRGLASVDSLLIYLKAFVRDAVKPYSRKILSNIGQIPRFQAIGSRTGVWYGAYRDQLFQSTDDTTWLLLPFSQGAIRAIHFLDDLTGFIATENGVYVSHDAGNTWGRELEGNFLDIASYERSVIYALTDRSLFRLELLAHATLTQSAGDLPEVSANPVYDIIHVSNVKSGSSWSLIDVLGRTVLSGGFTSGANFNIDVSAVPPGTYTLLADGRSIKIMKK